MFAHIYIHMDIKILSVLLLSLFQLFAMTMRVGRARKVAGVPYPYGKAIK